MKKLRDHFFDVVVYASVHRGLPYFDVVRIMDTTKSPSSTARTSTVVELLGGAAGRRPPAMRELPDGCPPDIEVGEGVYFRGG